MPASAAISRLQAVSMPGAGMAHATDGIHASAVLSFPDGTAADEASIRGRGCRYDVAVISGGERDLGNLHWFEAEHLAVEGQLRF